MTTIVKLSSKGQIVIPKDIRDELALREGEFMRVSRSGRQIILESAESSDDRISYAEFRRLVPKYSGPAIAVEDMNSEIDSLFSGWII